MPRRATFRWRSRGGPSFVGPCVDDSSALGAGRDREDELVTVNTWELVAVAGKMVGRTTRGPAAPCTGSGRCRRRRAASAPAEEEPRAPAPPPP
jgi:hypothetical protein